MKILLSALVLFCLVFLNVPRQLVHDCDHHHASTEHHDESSDSNISLEGDDCFVCEFDLGFFQVSQELAFNPLNGDYFILNESANDLHKADLLGAKVLRGPPARLI